jgi:uncharacterized membrane protein
VHFRHRQALVALKGQGGNSVDIVLVSFDQLSRARAAMSELRQLAEADAVTLHAAAIVVRETGGRFLVPEEEARVGHTGAAAGGVIGALLGALTGPYGLLLWGATGALVGSLADAEEAEVSDGVLVSVTQSMPPGTAVLIADIEEPTFGVVDAVMEKAGGRVTRRSKADVQAELAAAEEASLAARREANRVLRERRKAAGEETIGDRLSELKEKVTPSR